MSGKHNYDLIIKYHPNQSDRLFRMEFAIPAHEGDYLFAYDTNDIGNPLELGIVETVAHYSFPFRDENPISVLIVNRNNVELPRYQSFVEKYKLLHHF